MKNKRGITLIALIITIIILLILAGITITSIIDSGLFEKVKEAKNKQDKAQENENIILSDYEQSINKYIDGSRLDSDENLGDIELLVSANITKNSIGEYNIDSFTESKEKNFSKYLNYDESEVGYEILEDGWYMITLSDITCSTADCYSQLKLFYGDLCVRKLFTYASTYGQYNYDSDSATLYLKKGKNIKIKFILKNDISAGRGNCEYSIFKM